MADDGRNLTQLLKAAADRKPGAAEKFFETLLCSAVYIPVDSDLTRQKTARGVSVIGNGLEHFSQRKYVSVVYQGAEAVPIFTEAEFIGSWAECDFGVDRLDFKTLLWLLGEDTWLYINPAQEIGKELTPWEIDQLKQGADAIPTLVAALDEDGTEEFTISSSRDLYPELKSQLLPILQIYPELQEAFLVSLREGEEGAEKPALGIKYGAITEAKRIYLRSEIENASTQFLPAEEQLFLVDDLGNQDSPNWKLFCDSTPFYLVAKKQPEKSLGLFRRWTKALHGKLSRTRSKLS